jgi:pimeloyl-ACP methyl ester carboxylesterase
MTASASMQPGISSGQFQWRNHEIAYEIIGNGPETCILVHGLMLDSYLNHDLAFRFASAGYRVVLLDLLGHGRSSKPFDLREYRVDLYADQLLACMDHLQIEQAMIGGVSLGAITALNAAALAPQRVKALFLEMPVMEISTTFAALLFIPVLTALKRGPRVYRGFASLLQRVPRRWSDATQSVLHALSADPAVTSAVLHGILVGPVVPALAERRKLTMPALIIGHRRDRLHNFRDAEALAHDLPNARLLRANSILELRMRPERLWREIEPFLTQARLGAGMPFGASMPKGVRNPVAV